MGKMKRITTLCVALMMAVAGMAISFTYELSYEGFPYNKTRCENPSYVAGTAVKLSAGIPTKDDVPLVGWRYNGTIYLPGASFIMPSEDVVLQPVWSGEEGIELVENRKSIIDNRKILRDGQLLIIREGKVYNVIGVRIQ